MWGQGSGCPPLPLAPPKAEEACPASSGLRNLSWGQLLRAPCEWRPRATQNCTEGSSHAGPGPAGCSGCPSVRSSRLWKVLCRVSSDPPLPFCRRRVRLYLVLSPLCAVHAGWRESCFFGVKVSMWGYRGRWDGMCQWLNLGCTLVCFLHFRIKTIVTIKLTRPPSQLLIFSSEFGGSGNVYFECWEAYFIYP